MGALRTLASQVHIALILGGAIVLAIDLSLVDLAVTIPEATGTFGATLFGTGIVG